MIVLAWHEASNELLVVHVEEVIADYGSRVKFRTTEGNLAVAQFDPAGHIASVTLQPSRLIT
jgi:hypothetical protein